MKPKLHTVQVSPILPKALAPLEELARNIAWDWMPEAESLFQRIDPLLWERTGRNPTKLLGEVAQTRLESLAADVGFLAHLHRVQEAISQYRAEPRWFQHAHLGDSDVQIAYFSAEFGLTDSLPIYSGGLGVLAGDHLKSASDLGVPLIGVGLLYQEGYFRQYLNADGWQLETYPPNDFYRMPMEQVRHDDGRAVQVSVEFPGRLVYAQLWRVQVGRIPLVLLDTNVSENSEADRKITRALYSGGVELRIQQLMILGIGGFRALVAMGKEPTICHMNEGHAGFLGVERTRHLMEQRGISYELARDIAEDGNVFTTHTPVPAGFDVFGRDLVERYMSDYIRTVGISMDAFMKLGSRRPDPSEPLNMAIIAIRHSALRNGVSRLHGKVSRKMVQANGAWTDWPQHEVPIDSVTNGIHTRTWIAPEIATLLSRYLGPRWLDEPGGGRTWRGIDEIPDEELWRAHVELRAQLVTYVRQRLRWQAERRGASQGQCEDTRHVLDPDALTIGFARRFATYKRATLLFRDPERLKRIVHHHAGPVQFIFAGKAHPADVPAKELIKRISNLIKEEAFHGSIAFLEDYEIPVAKHLVRGVDVWLNTPQRPKEASGTSGMKVVPNGGLNLSILDGWWAEGYDPGVGWAIGNGEDHQEDRDEVEASALYDLLETQVVPLFYERDARKCPRTWVSMMKRSMGRLAAQFSSDRMVMEYTNRFYLTAAARYRSRTNGDMKLAGGLADWKRKVASAWPQVRVLEVSSPNGDATRIGEAFEVQARLRLGALEPADVDVQLYHGILDARDEVHHASVHSMTWTRGTDGLHEYSACLPFRTSGRYGYTVRVIPKHEGVLVPNELPWIRWAQS